MIRPGAEEEVLLLENDLDSDRLPVYYIIHLEVCAADKPWTREALLSPEFEYKLISPFLEKYLKVKIDGQRAVVFALLVNRARFLNDDCSSTKAVSSTRAALCEILAIRGLRFYDDERELAVVLGTRWPVLDDASDKVKSQVDKAVGLVNVRKRVGNAVELAILVNAKEFIASPGCQKFISSVWNGKILYPAWYDSSCSADTYKPTPSLYNPKKASLLDHTRLKVPMIRAMLLYCNFLVLLTLFLAAMVMSKADRLTLSEGLFIVYVLGYCLEKFVIIEERGFRLYSTGTWRGFNMLFVTVILLYVILRLYGVYFGGMSWLAFVAVLIIPRLVFMTLSSNNTSLALRSMVVEFAFVISIAVFCFAGFWCALWILSRDKENGYSSSQIGRWMLDLWLQLDSSGFDKAANFHPVIGPALMILYACLSGTFLLAVLVSSLSYTFAATGKDAETEIIFRRSRNIIMDVKVDAIYSYQPPINLIALAVLLPLNRIMNAEWYRSFNVFLIRLINLPLLLTIAFFESRTPVMSAGSFPEAGSKIMKNVTENLPGPIKRVGIFGSFLGYREEINAIFDFEDETERKTVENVLICEDAAEDLLTSEIPLDPTPSKIRINLSDPTVLSLTPTRPQAPNVGPHDDGASPAPSLDSLPGQHQHYPKSPEREYLNSDSEFGSSPQAIITRPTPQNMIRWRKISDKRHPRRLSDPQMSRYEFNLSEFSKNTAVFGPELDVGSSPGPVTFTRSHRGEGPDSTNCEQHSDEVLRKLEEAKTDILRIEGLLEQVLCRLSGSDQAVSGLYNN